MIADVPGLMPHESTPAAYFRSGFVAVVGRPNVGKSTLVNAMVGSKVSIMSSRPNTTRHDIRGILHRQDAQVVFVDTPGMHRPRSPLGERLNDKAGAILGDVDVILVVVDATAPVGPGDHRVLEQVLARLRREEVEDHGDVEDHAGDLPGDAGLDTVIAGTDSAGRRAEAVDSRVLVVVNKIDRARPEQVLISLATVDEVVRKILGGRGGAHDAARDATVRDATAQDDAAGDTGVELFPVSAATGAGVGALVSAVVDRLPFGPRYFPKDMVTDLPEAVRVAELVREQILARVRDELPHSVACQVTEWEWPRIRCEIIVERESQKAIVIGRGAEHLKAAGIAVRQELPPGAFLDLHVHVERHWQRRKDLLDRFGY